MKKILVVCKFNEDTQWVDDVPSDWERLIITKNIDVPNFGRDPTSMMYAIFQNYESIEDDDLWCFTQGHPFDHYSDLINYLTNLQPEGVNGYIPLNDAGGMMFYDKTYADYAKKWWGLEFDTPWFFYGSCQFVVTGKDIKRYPKSGYEDCYHDMMLNEQLMYCQERLFTPMYGS
jgi:hypothetical protein